MSPIGRITHRSRETVFGSGEPGPVTRRVHDELDGIQAGRLPDARGWTAFVD